jgi:Lrp/AsnC family transcriptional regulator, leucine-responsive regulatory protein
MSPPMPLDDTDWSILAELQDDGRLSVAELGRRVNMSTSATAERVRRLEQAGVITGYRAVVDPARLGLPVLAIVRLKYPGNRHEPLRRLLAERTEVLECLRVTGDDCYILRVAATSMAHLEQVVDALAEFGSTTTTVVYSAMVALRGVSPRPATSSAG